MPASLISVDELHALLARMADRPTVLDVRWQLGGGPGREEYARGHIPGAVFIDLDAELAGAPGAGGRHPLPGGEAFAASMRAAGVSEDRAVVVYDDATSLACARAWWLLRYFGHSRAAVLDGGLSAWARTGYPLEFEPARAEPGNFVACPGGMPVLDAAGAASLAESGLLIDARAPDRFRGESEPVDPVAGHIPGAVNVPATANVDATGRFLDRATLRARFERSGAREGVEIGAYCGSGVVAAHEVLALELAGYRAQLYVGSWSEWIRDRSRPVRTGASRGARHSRAV